MEPKRIKSNDNVKVVKAQRNGCGCSGKKTRLLAHEKQPTKKRIF